MPQPARHKKQISFVLAQAKAGADIKYGQIPKEYVNSLYLIYLFLLNKNPQIFCKFPLCPRGAVIIVPSTAPVVELVDALDSKWDYVLKIR